MKTSNNNAVINVRVSADVKKKSQELFDDLGLNTTTAINIFLKKAIEVGGIPFDIKKDECSHIPNDETILAIEQNELDRKNGDNSKVYNSVDDVLEAMNTYRKGNG